MAAMTLEHCSLLVPRLQPSIPCSLQHLAGTASGCCPMHTGHLQCFTCPCCQRTEMQGGRVARIAFPPVKVAPCAMQTLWSCMWQVCDSHVGERSWVLAFRKGPA